MSHLLWILLAVQVRTVQPPVSVTVAAPGSNATLQCSFSARKSLNITNLIINWQYGETVVHSFYQGKDQLERQEKTYRGRTHLFEKELLEGNASLLLTSLQLNDEGEYTCYVNNAQESTSGDIMLSLAAPFDEPLLSLQPTCDSVNITVTLSNGYPQPQLRWHDSSGRDLDQTYSSVQLDSRGRYQVSSTINFRSNSIETIIMEMKLDVLSQTITRALLLHPPPDPCQECCLMSSTSRNRIPMGMSLLMFFGTLLVLLIIFLKKWMRGDQM
ncbi:CD276 antigen-like [Salminus brasiliensis]|uniref:CD276 antigen-like n=1 Tax=Salminus brasiliensis TaxID=930266 RepID=UPI003B83A43B